MRKKITFIILLIMAHTSAFAIGTLKDTVIVASANNVILTYQTTAGYSQPVVNASSDLNSLAVQAIYGFNFDALATTNLSAPTDLNRGTGAGVTVNFSQSIVNISNDLTDIAMRVTGSAVSVTGNTGTLSNWLFSVTNTTLNVAVDTASTNWQPRIKPAGDAVNGSRAGISLNVTIPGNTPDNMQYTGYNNNLYGGYMSYTYFYSATIAGPSLRLVSKASVVDSSGLTGTGYTGGNQDLVPGAKVTYTIVVTNDGSADASTVNITERIPVNTRFYSINAGDHNSISYIDLSDVVHNTFDLPSANVKAVVFKKNTLLQNGGTATFNYSVTLN